jgi:GDPmannose 4,6-dehydratase
MPEYTGNSTGLGTVRILEAIRRSGVRTRFYQASTSELYGSAPAPQSELTPFEPQSPYAIAKLYSYWLVKNYREAYNMYACNGILFNHESPRRGETFVTRKITRALAHILSGKQKTLFLGNLDAKRDWGFAAEYVMMMWLMLQQDAPDDYTVGTGDTHTVREFVNDTFSYAGIELEWEGTGAREKARVKSVVDRFAHTVKTGSVVVEILPRYFRPTEVDWLQADISKAKNKLQWEPKVGYRDLYRLMVDYDMLFEKLEAPMQGIEAINALGYNWIRQPLHNITGGMF